MAAETPPVVLEPMHSTQNPSPRMLKFIEYKMDLQPSPENDVRYEEEPEFDEGARNTELKQKRKLQIKKRPKSTTTSLAGKLRLRSSLLSYDSKKCGKETEE